MSDGPALPPSARGLLVTGEGPGLDRAQLASARHAARTADEVRWIGVIERDVLEDAYRYRTVSVDVETAYVVVVDLESGRPVTRLTIEAAPPERSATPLALYALEDRRVWQAIDDALREAR